MENNFDTICAIVTPMARSAVGIIRISGSLSYKIAKEIFSSKIEPKSLNYGFIKDDTGEIIDEVILLAFQSPHSYTGEDVIEIQTHGNPAILNSVYELILSHGARPAQRGEFTKRAFLNHRLDLSQAEAVADIIDAKNQKAASDALSNLSGYLKNQISSLKKDLSDLYSKVIASIDFPEDVEEIDIKTIEAKCIDNIQKINSILQNSKSHDYIREGINACLIGAPNVGKSSLFNALLNYNRAIVTEIEGTTRDTIKETINLEGFLVNFVDTAGIRDKNKADKVEAIGIENSIETIKMSDIVLFLFENSIDETEKSLIELALDKKYLFIKTKADISSSPCPENALEVSSKTSFGIDKLKKKIMDIIKELVPEDTGYTTNKRQQACLLRSKEALENALYTLKQSALADLIADDLKSAILALDEITGEILTDKILDNIFDNFCIGK